MVKRILSISMLLFVAFFSGRALAHTPLCSCYDNGVFAFGIPKAGWWGFAALDLDPDYQYKGGKCSRDAVIWIKAVDMK